MVEIFMAMDSVAICNDLDEAHQWLRDHGVGDDHHFHIQDIETGEIVSHTHNGQLCV